MSILDTATNVRYNGKNAQQAYLNGKQIWQITPSPSLTPSPSFTPSVTITNTITFTPSFTPSNTITLTPSFTPTITPSFTQTFTPSLTPSFTQTVTSTETESPTPTPSYTETESPTPSVTEVGVSPSVTPSIFEVMASFTPSMTITPTTVSPSLTPSRTVTPSRTPSFTPTPSRTPSRTPSETPSLSIPITPSRTITPTRSETPTPTITPSITRTITATPSFTPTPSLTKTITPSPTLTPSITPSITPITTTLYSNFDAYIVGGVRQASTGDLIRTNISTSRRLIVTETITIYGFKLVRIPPDNWTSTNYLFVPTLSVVSGTGATIDGGTSSKGFTNARVILNPVSVSERGTPTTSQYDISIMTPTGDTSTTLTAGEYSLSVLGNSANMIIATLTTATFPIDTSKKIYPSGSVTHFAMEVF